MINIAYGNLLLCNAQALVNTVNCVGVMGGGIALQFKRMFPTNFLKYEAACNVGAVVPGRMFIHELEGFHSPQYIINFPTKRHYVNHSFLPDIESGLQSLIVDVERLDIKSIAIPALGCGLGGLDWDVVRPLIESAFSTLTDVQVLLFEPQ